jgi:hypothetical protein
MHPQCSIGQSFLQELSIAQTLLPWRVLPS